MAVNKTLYVRDEDAPVWEKARELVGEKLSSFLTNYLKEFVAREEGRAQGFERITLKFRERGLLPRAIAFSGRWLIPPSENRRYLEHPGEYDSFAVAVTAKGKIAVLIFGKFAESEDGFIPWGEFQIFESFETASGKTPRGLIATAMERMGIEVQELDI